jgi:protein SCO1
MRAPLLLLVAVYLLVGCSDTRSYETKGRVISVDPSAGALVVDHEDIPGLMPAMTMRLKVADARELDPIASGDAVAFRLNLNADSTWVDRIVLLDPTAVTGRPSQPLINPDAEASAVMPGEVVPSFAVVDHDGVEIRDVDLAGAPYLITFIYTRCPLPDYCPLMTQRFLAIQRTIIDEGLRTRLVAASVDPEYDRPEVLAEYGQRVGASPDHWRFVTGSPEQISHLATIFGVFYSEDGDEINHNLSTVLVGRDGRVRSLWRGNEWSVDEVISAIRRVETVERERDST